MTKERITRGDVVALAYGATISEKLYWEMLEVLPPAFWKGELFLVGEPLRHNSAGQEIYQAFTKVGENHYQLPNCTIESARDLSAEASIDWARKEESLANALHSLCLQSESPIAIF